MRLTRLVVAALFIASTAVETRQVSVRSDWAVSGGGTWVYGNGLVRQADSSVAIAKKYLLPALSSASDQDVVAQVRVDSFPSSGSRIGVSLRTNVATGFGYNFVLLAGDRVGFLADNIAWGNACSYAWSFGNWYWMRLSSAGGTLTGKIWLDGQTEAQATVCTQSGWTFFASGAPGLNGGSNGETASFNAAVVGSYSDDFNTNAPPSPAPPPRGFLSSGDFAANVQTTAKEQGFDLGGFVNIMTATTQNLLCVNDTGACRSYTPGTFAIVPSPYYGVGTWTRDSVWGLAALNRVDLFAQQVSRLASVSNIGTGRVPTIVFNDGTPWFGAGGQGNPVPDDDSNLMYAISARLGWQTAASQPFLNTVYAWIKAHADAAGRYATTSFGWEDSFYPLGTSGAASVTVSANMQGLYAVALRSLKDVGVDVPQIEIDNANAQYVALTMNGRLRAYDGSDVVDVASLMGDALSLFIWNQPILSDATVQNTIAAFSEVFDSSGNFVGYKVLSNADGSYLAPSMFPVEGNGAGAGRGWYQNGGSWFLFDALALYDGARHEIPSMRATYVDRLVKRMASELRAGSGGARFNKSNEFLCTAAGNAGDGCGPIGSAELARSDYGWNAFVVRLLSNESPSDGAIVPPFGTIDTPAAGTSGVTGSIAVTGWALDDKGVTGVRVLRDAAAGEPPGTQIFIGNAVLVDGARPDVAARYPSYPFNTRGWGYLLLTNMLPNHGNGPFTFYAYADDADGHSTLLGSRAIACANASATKPFGAIDTPAQGETISGSAFVNFGWALTPQPNSIPLDGSTIDVYIDGAAVGHPDYGHPRGDIQSLFPGYANTNTAVGAFIIDTTKLSNGIHSIFWAVRDSGGNAEGIGSRFFTVANP